MNNLLIYLLSEQFDGSDALPPGKYRKAAVEWKDVWAPETVWTVLGNR